MLTPEAFPCSWRSQCAEYFLLLPCPSCFAGCASNRTDLVKTGYLPPTHAHRFTLASAEVYEQDGGLVVDGRLDAAEATKGNHVDVQVVAPMDKSFTTHRSTTASLAQTQTGPGVSYRGPRSAADSHATYSVRFGLPPEGSVVRVKYDSQPHQAEGSK